MSVYCIINQTMRLSDPTRKVNLSEPLAYSNQRAHAFRVTVLAEGSDDPADLTGIGVTAAFMRVKSNDTVTPIIGTVTGNVAEVVLPASCYNVVGRFTLTVDLSMPTDPTGLAEFDATATYAIGDRVAYDGKSFVFKAVHTGAWDAADVYAEVECRTALWADGIVEKNTTESIIDPGTPVANYTEVINSANAAASSAISAAANANTAAAAANNAVSYSVQTGKSETEKANARKNIGAVEPDFVNALHGLVDYDYSTPYSETWTAGMTVTRIDTRLTFDGKSPSANGVPLYFKLNGTVTYGNKNSTATLDDEGLVLKAGHKYRFRLLVRGGSYSSWAPTSALQYPIYPRVYKYGDMGDVFYNFTYLPDGMSSFVDFDYQDSYNGVYPCIMINRRSGGNAALFDNVEIEAVIEDITNGIHELPAPTVDGTYTLKCTVTNGVPTFSWVSEGSGLLGTPLTGGDTE